MAESEKHNSLTPVLIAIGALAVLIPATVFYYLHVSSQESYFRDRGFRALGEIATTMDLTLRGMQSLENLNPTKDTDRSGDIRQELESREATLREFTSLLNNLELSVETLDRQWRDGQSKVKELEQELETHNDNSEKLQQSIDERLAQAEPDKKRELQLTRELDEARSNLIAIDSQIELVNQQLAEGKAILADLTPQKDQQEQRNQQLEQEGSIEREAAMDFLAMQINRGKEALSQLDSSDELSVQLAAISEALDALTIENLEFNASKELAVLVNNTSKSSGNPPCPDADCIYTLESVISEIRWLQDYLVESQRHYQSELSFRKREVADLSEYLDGISDQQVALNKQLTSMQADRDSFTDSVNETSENLEALRENGSELDEEIELLIEEQRQLEDIIAGLQQQIDSTESRNRSVERRLSRTNQQIASVLLERSSLVQHLAISKSLLADFESYEQSVRLSPLFRDIRIKETATEDCKGINIVDGTTIRHCGKSSAYSIPASSLWRDITDRMEFDHIIIADNDRNVVYSAKVGSQDQHVNTYGIRNVSHLIHGLESQNEADDESGEDTEPGNDDPPGKSEIDTASVAELSLAGKSVMVYGMPVRLAATGTDIWYVFGLVESAKTRSQALTTSIAFIGLILMALLLGLISWPLFKLAFMGAREALSRSETFFIAVSSVFALSIVTVSILEIWSYQANRLSFDALAQEIHQRMDAAVTKDLTGVWAAMNGDIDVKGALEPENALVLPLPTDDGTAQLPPFTTSFLLDNKGEQCGRQVNYIQKPYPRLRVSGRQYYRQIVEGDAWQWQAGGNSFPSGYFAQRIVNYSDGRKTTTISAPYSKGQKFPGYKGDEDCKPAVIVVGTRLHSLFQPVLPEGYQFAIVDRRTCEVLYHSNDRRSMVENFCEEVDGDEDVVSAIHGDFHLPKSTRYHGNNVRLYTRPLSAVPWVLVVSYDLDRLQTFHFNVSLIAVFFLFLFILALVLYFFVLKLLRPITSPRTTTWSALWPQWQRSNVYLLTLALVSLSSGIVVIAVLTEESRWLLTWITCLHTIFCLSIFQFLAEASPYRKNMRTTLLHTPGTWFALLLWPVFLNVDLPLFWAAVSWLGYVAVAAAVLYRRLDILNFINRHTGEWFVGNGGSINSPRFRKLYVSTGVLVLLSIGTLPALVFFMDAHTTQAEVYRRLALETLQDNLEQQDKELTSFSRVLYQSLDAPDLARQSSDQAIYAVRCPGHYTRLGCTGGYESFPPDDSRGKGSYLSNSRLDDSWDEQVKKVINRGPSAAIALMIPPYSENARLLLHGYRWLAEFEDKYVRSAGTLLPHLSLRTVLVNRYWELLFYLVVLVFLLHMFVRAAARRMFALAVPFGAGQWGRSARFGRDIQEQNRFIYIAPQPSDWQAVRSQANLVEINLTKPPATESVRLQLCTRSCTVLVYNLEAIIGETDIRKNALRLIELVCEDYQHNHSVFLFADVAPLYRLTYPREFPEVAGIQAGADEPYRWSRVMSRFEKRYCVPAWDPVDIDLPEVELALDMECSAFPGLEKLRDRLRSKCRGNNPRMNREQVIAEVGNYAGAFYRRLWILTTAEERLILYNVANRQSINTENMDAIEHLLRKGLLVRDPALRIANESLARFIQSAEPVETFDGWRKEGPMSNWTLLKVPLMTLLVLLLGLFIMVGGDEFRTVLTTLTGVLAVLPVLFKVFSLIRTPGAADTDT